ncbi:acyl-CoA thioesterase [Bacteroidales bacterium OttesenSCG-928-A17]|nr:acyl-CoA thioesterase [Bacteroidales bacterium OttesenSCG-928-A17]
MKKVFQIEMKVRDYECDAQGIVNNANYLHYFEVTRHEFMVSLNIPFVESHAKGVDPVLSRADIHYKTPLVGNDVFVSSFTVERKGVKMIFNQEIHRKRDMELCCKAKIEVAVLINGKISRGDYYDEMMKEYLMN